MNQGYSWLVLYFFVYISYLCFMKLEFLLRAILPDVLIDNFDIVRFEKSADRFDIFLDEKKVQLKDDKRNPEWLDKSSNEDLQLRL